MLKKPIGIWPWLLERNEMGIKDDLDCRIIDLKMRDIVSDYRIFSKWRIILLSQVQINLRSIKYAPGIYDKFCVTDLIAGYHNILDTFRVNKKDSIF